MTETFERGFKARVERLALAVRRELGLSAHDPLDPHALARHLGVEVVTLRDLASWGVSESSIRQFLNVSPEDFSALTITVGQHQLVVENPRHSLNRRASSLAHELAHILLEHGPGPALGVGGCRTWNKRDEDEADWLAGELLIPRTAALRIARLGTAVAEAARHFGVSSSLMEWRLNHSGARLQARRERLARTPR